MKLLICGSRDWEDWTVIAKRLIDAQRNLGVFEIVTGTKRDERRAFRGVPQIGADRIAHDLAIEMRLPCTVIEADWKTYGKAAGPRRNRAMLNLQPDLVLAFWDGRSRGTQDTIDEARKRGIPVEVVMKAEAT